MLSEVFKGGPLQSTIDSIDPTVGIKSQLADDIADYVTLDNEVKTLMAARDAAKERILAGMDALNVSSFASEYGKCNIIGESQRVTYPKSDLDSIAKNNKALAAILSKIKKTSTVGRYCRIQSLG